MHPNERMITHFALEFDIRMLSKIQGNCFIRRELVSTEMAKRWLAEPELVFCFKAEERSVINGVLRWLGSSHTSKTVRSYHTFQHDFDWGLLVLQVDGEIPTADELDGKIQNGTYQFHLYRIFV